MTISRPLESIICSAKNKSPARNCSHGKELQIHGVEDGFEGPMIAIGIHITVTGEKFQQLMTYSF